MQAEYKGLDYGEQSSWHESARRGNVKCNTARPTNACLPKRKMLKATDVKVIVD